MWLRAFGRELTHPKLTSLCEHLQKAGLKVVPHFRGDDLGWTEGEIELVDAKATIGLARYLTEEDNLREDLNAYAAELESYADIQQGTKELMERVIQTRQMITIRKPINGNNEILMEKACELIASYFAERIDGVYQIDGQGWYLATGERLITEY